MGSPPMNDSGLGKLPGAIFRCSMFVSTGYSLSLLDRPGLARFRMLHRPLPVLALLGCLAPHLAAEHAAEHAAGLTRALRRFELVDCTAGLSGGALCHRAAAHYLGSSLS
eukprot:11192321-Lingulodinium_polyedra.AAC.1